MSTNSQLKLIHTLKAASGIDDSDYLVLLSAFNVKSSKDLTLDQARELIKKLEYIAIGAGAWKPKRTMRWDNLDNRPGMATPLQLRHLEGLWVSVSRQPTLHEKQEAFNHFLNNRFGIARIEWIPIEMVSKIKRTLMIMRSQNEKVNSKLQESDRARPVDNRTAGSDLCVDHNR